jgi:hypothetical protein
MHASEIENSGKSTKDEKASATSMEVLALTIEVRANQKNTMNNMRDSLESSSAISAFAALMAFMLRGLLFNVKVTGACPIQVASGFDVSFQIEGKKPIESAIATATSSLFEKVRGFVQDFSLSSDILKVGNDVAKLISAGELTCQPKINPAKPHQNETAVLDNDGTIWVMITNGSILVKRYKKLLHLAGFVNACGYVITLKIGKKTFKLTPLPINPTKADWIVTETLRLRPLVSGYHPEHKSVEILYDDEFVQHSVPADNSELYIEAMHHKKAMEILVEVSRPSNPFLSDPPKLRISETIKIVDPSGQDEIDLSKSK